MALRAPSPGAEKTKQLPREARGWEAGAALMRHLDGELVRRAPREPPHGPAGPLLQPEGSSGLQRCSGALLGELSPA